MYHMSPMIKNRQIKIKLFLKINNGNHKQPFLKYQPSTISLKLSPPT